MQPVRDFFNKALVRKILGVAFVIAAASVLIAPGIGKITRFTLMATRSTFLNGTIIEQGMGRMSGCRPYISYTDLDGQQREFKSDIIYHYFFCPQVGDDVTILSEKDDPSKTYVYSLSQYILIPLMLICVGIAVIYITLFRKPKLQGQFSMLPVKENISLSKESQE